MLGTRNYYRAHDYAGGGDRHAAWTHQSAADVRVKGGILGGTGPQGRGLARRLAAAGHDVLIGSRSAERAEHIAADYRAAGHSSQIAGGSNSDAAAAELVIVTVPYDGHADLLSALATELAGKIVVDSG